MVNLGLLVEDQRLKVEICCDQPRIIRETARGLEIISENENSYFL